MIFANAVNGLMASLPESFIRQKKMSATQYRMGRKFKTKYCSTSIARRSQWVKKMKFLNFFRPFKRCQSYLTISASRPHNNPIQHHRRRTAAHDMETLCPPSRKNAVQRLLAWVFGELWSESPFLGFPNVGSLGRNVFFKC